MTRNGENRRTVFVFSRARIRTKDYREVRLTIYVIPFDITPSRRKKVGKTIPAKFSFTVDDVERGYRRDFYYKIAITRIFGVVSRRGSSAKEPVTYVLMSGEGKVYCPICQCEIRYYAIIDLEIPGKHLSSSEVDQLIERLKSRKMLLFATSAMALFQHIVRDHNVVHHFETYRLSRTRIATKSTVLVFWTPKVRYHCKFCGRVIKKINNFVKHLLKRHYYDVEKEREHIRSNIDAIREEYKSSFRKLEEEVLEKIAARISKS